MQILSGSVGLSLPSSEAGNTTDSVSTTGADLASGLGFLALFTTQINSATKNPELNKILPDLLKNQLSDAGTDGKSLPLRSLFSDQTMQLETMFNQLISGKGRDLISDNKLFSNISSEVLSSQRILDAIQGDGEPDSFTQSLLQELGLTALRGKGSQTGFSAITAQLGHHGWSDELVSRVKWQIGQEIQEAKISLNPRELGPLQVKINISDDQAHVHFVAHHGTVRDAIEDAIPRLREMLEQSGLMLADANVSQQSPGQHQTASEDENLDNENFHGNRTENVEQEHPVKIVRAGVGLVDAFI